MSSSLLNIGATGLQVANINLQVTGNNIANANTTGFKTSRPEFQDIVGAAVKNTIGGNQIGRGIRLSGVKEMMSQGAIVSSDSPTDDASATPPCSKSFTRCWKPPARGWLTCRGTSFRAAIPPWS